MLVSLDVAADGQVRGILQVERRRDPSRQLFGTAPLIATSLIRSTGMITAPAIVMVACGLLTTLASLGVSRDRGYVLSREDSGSVRL